MRRLKFCNFKLDTLLSITQTINENLPTEQLLQRYETLLRQELNIGKVLLFSYNKEWIRLLESGVKSSKPDSEVNVETDLLPIKEITTTSESENDFIRTFDIIIPVFRNNVAMAYVLIGDIDEEKEGMSPTIKHLRFIQTLTNIIVVAIENRRLYRESLRQEAMRKELELASRMQSMLIPDPDLFPRNDKVQVAAFYLPHFEVGGDYYDFFKLNDHEYGFCIADVSGKGISAAILMSNFQANLKALFTAGISFTDLIEKLNSRVLSNAKGEKFITLFVARYNSNTKMLQFVNAAHNSPILYDKETKSLQYLESGCPGMGMLDEIPVIKQESIQITSTKGTKLLCYTDGLVELRGVEEVELNMRIIEQYLSNDFLIDRTLENMIEGLEITKQNRKFFDDISMLGIEFF